MKPWNRLLFIPLVLGLALTALVGAQHLLSRPDLAAFRPEQMARLEAGMWRSYYAGRWARLATEAWQVAASQYRYSWLDSARLSFHAAYAAACFRTNTEDPRCVPHLERYYRVVQRACPEPLDVSEAARLELRWWQERRQNMAPAGYAPTIATLTALLYGLTPADTLPAALLRAEAMAYRDARRQGRMTDSDWEAVSAKLRLAYASLKDAIDPPRRFSTQSHS